MKNLLLFLVGISLFIPTVVFGQQQMHLNLAENGTINDSNYELLDAAAGINNWNKVWTNNLDGKIGAYTVSANSLFYSGDFDGDGMEELLCVTYTSNSSTTDLMMLLKYENGNWTTKWTNNGSEAGTGGGLYPYRSALSVGDFDGDGKDELIGIGEWITTFRFSNNSWHWWWSNYGNSNHPFYRRDKIYIGDYDGDGKDEIFGYRSSNGATDLYKWVNNDFGVFWSDHTMSHQVSLYAPNMISGDFNNDGKDILLGGLGGNGTWVTSFYFRNNDWNWGWSTYGNPYIGVTRLPLSSSDLILVGNIDSDGHDEVMIFHTVTNGSWAVSMDGSAEWRTNWIASSTAPFIDDWTLNPNGGYNTKYHLIKPVINQPSYLLAMRRFGSKFLVSMYKTDGINNFKSTATDLVDISEPFNEISVFPNPSSGELNISTNGNEVKNLEVYNIQGQMIFTRECNSSDNINFDISEQPDGLYILKVYDNKGSINHHKFVLKK